MTANKMPELPAIRRAFYCIDSGRACETDQHEWPESPGFRNVLLITPAELAAHERACYLAGLEAAKACVPPSAVKNDDGKWEAACGAVTLTLALPAAMAWNTLAIATVAGITALEQEAKK